MRCSLGVLPAGMVKGMAMLLWLLGIVLAWPAQAAIDITATEAVISILRPRPWC